MVTVLLDVLIIRLIACDFALFHLHREVIRNIIIGKFLIKVFDVIEIEVVVVVLDSGIEPVRVLNLRRKVAINLWDTPAISAKKFDNL